ncbi:AAA family ATPase [Brevibacillus laterosporus]|uniref:Replication-associated recombination protein A n=1 Tax=Brevibacillus laterosporus LMG 15441 TaxID=1042163 RepID=A0A075R7T1_BRELA|nr:MULTISPECIES: AAA family ATPase [Brevibacillus]AIG25640.1 replication-associated recombination protein A [Brevibacillus laterosporus LMG 15441]AUM64193.1 replication-associated recombination protein A [Brevibacillus laterosporus]MBA4531148.1 AAA family ATPase [Brevibacillus halotolerans]MCR8994001.1 AAA family ATPase [Brevibacillus laterosporus]MDF9413760.1 AAA family ATPase [Brevibacillus laterosporus]
MDLFSFAHEQEDSKGRTKPLAARMRPKNLDEVVGQQHILAKGSLLRRAIEADQISSLIFYGPPGTGKTTLAKVIARTTKSHFSELNAVTAGVADIRRIVEEAKDRLVMNNQRTTLFIDEIHRFNKSQQDALLPYVEEGTVILIGATTENPFFEVNAALLSRSQIFSLQSLTDEDLGQVIDRALTDELEGLGELRVKMTPEAKEHLMHYAEGDARRLLNALELAATTTPLNEAGEIVITLDVAVESIQRRAVRYDKSGDNHYDTVSAFIKSIRGSDPDGALYWLARMIDAGEDPRFIARRLIISASEDIGNADPQALSVAVSCFQALELIGMPEGRIALGQATTYLATAPKSNAAYMGINQALMHVQKEGHKPVPVHLRDRHYKGAARLGHGEGYLYPHNYPEGYVKQRYLPEGVEEKFYEPKPIGYEAEIQKRQASRN